MKLVKVRMPAMEKTARYALYRAKKEGEEINKAMES
jgi:hypothetical protein